MASWFLNKILTVYKRPSDSSDYQYAARAASAGASTPSAGCRRGPVRAAGHGSRAVAPSLPSPIPGPSAGGSALAHERRDCSTNIHCDLARHATGDLLLVAGESVTHLVGPIAQGTG